MSTYREKAQQEEDRAWLLTLLSSAQAKGWFGKITIVFEGGRIRRGHAEQSLLPPSAGGPGEAKIMELRGN